MARKLTTPTTTSLIMEVLTSPGADFVSRNQLVARTGRTPNQVVAALHHLREHHAVDVVIEVDGTGWWFATPDYDNRITTIAEYTEHTKPNRKARTRR